MQKPLSDIARFIKNIIPEDITETYTLKSIFKHVTNEEDIRNDVLVFKNFLCQLYDRLIAYGSLYDKPFKNVKDEILDHTCLPVEYPFLNNIKSILINLGYYGELTCNGTSLSLGNIQRFDTAISANGSPLKSKITAPKIMEALQFLMDCGMHFDGIDLSAKKLDISNTNLLEITYPDNPAMLTGLKVMAIAQKELYIKGNDELFLRCDYRMLEDRELDIISLLKDYVRPLPAEVQKFVLNLHKRYLAAGLTCRAEVWYLRLRFTYSFKSKKIWAFSTSLNYKHRILIRAENTHHYTDTIKNFAMPLQEKIAKGYGCDRKKYGKPCQGGCQGYSITLDNSVLDMSEDIETWLDKELSCIKGYNTIKKEKQ